MPFAPALTDELRRYFYIGGMPEIVAAEVKAGTSVASRGFVHFLARHETNVTGLRFSLLPHRAETHLVNIPLWAVAAMP